MRHITTISSFAKYSWPKSHNGKNRINCLLWVIHDADSRDIVFPELIIRKEASYKGSAINIQR